MRITAEGFAEVEDTLKGVKSRIENLKPVLDVALMDTVTLIDDSFDSQRSPGDIEWAPLLPATIERRRKGGGNASPQILIDTGRLRQSITGRTNRKGFEFGTNVVYAGAHQFGRPGKNLPARPFLPVDAEDGGSYKLSTTGAGGRHWSEVRRMIANYIRTGRVK